MKTSKNNLRFLLCGGGTGGHIYPAVAIADALKEKHPGSEFLFVGSRKNIEEQVIPRRGYPIRFIRSEPFSSVKNPLRFLKMSAVNAVGVSQAIRILLSFRPHLLIAMGGYVAAPTVLAWFLLKKAGLLRIPCFIHEQNVIPGKMNRLAGAMADCIGISFAESADHFPIEKVSLVGYPVRKEIQRRDKESSRKELGIDVRNKVILAFGGSQGSRAINHAAVEALAHLSGLEGLTFIHATGQGREGWDYDPQADTTRRMAEFGLRESDLSWYRQVGYIEHIDKYYAASDLIICRAGAGTLNEIMLCGLPSVVVPKAEVAADHQVHNAMVLQRKGAAVVLFEHPVLDNGQRVFEVKGRELFMTIERLLSDPDKLRDMGHKARDMAFQDARDRVVRQVQALLEGRGVLFPSPAAYNNNNETAWAALPLDRIATLLKARGTRAVSGMSNMERRYIQYKVDCALSTEDFLLLCRGARVAGLIKYSEKLPLLLELMEKKRPAPVWQRFLGADFIPVGFVRRDIMEALQWLGVWNETVRRILHLGLEDPYFETRSAAARAVTALAQKIDDPGSLENLLRRCLEDSNVEVVWESLLALGKICRDAGFMGVIAAFRYHPSWKIRKAAIDAMADLLRRRVVKGPQVSLHMEAFLVTCNDFKPNFPLKQSLTELKALVASMQKSDFSSITANESQNRRLPHEGISASQGENDAGSKGNRSLAGPHARWPPGDEH
ncbi:MAG: UDP-N-acetylglucosamine--N-acetylmuramyl-(pentapeptide) pyrophosphoryl-undecaprenol N-acetylglucosamine transferase [Deltaproteobacteria bacterium]|nr:UDP-N-acetylglucosamine--N-acetylmuramyl-(pentapeptide) pyrophosphoryl-undecaprenol N-acetylglucosamine transferase [Deltaproteobacteria bacterium]